MGIQPSTIVLFLIVMSSIRFCKSRSVEMFRPPSSLNEPNRYWGKKLDKIRGIMSPIWWDRYILKFTAFLLSCNTGWISDKIYTPSTNAQRNSVHWLKKLGNSREATKTCDSSNIRRRLRRKLHHGLVSWIEWR